METGRRKRPVFLYKNKLEWGCLFVYEYIANEP